SEPHDAVPRRAAPAPAIAPRAVWLHRARAQRVLPVAARAFGAHRFRMGVFFRSRRVVSAHGYISVRRAAQSPRRRGLRRNLRVGISLAVSAGDVGGLRAARRLARPLCAARNADGPHAQARLVWKEHADGLSISLQWTRRGSERARSVTDSRGMQE